MPRSRLEVRSARTRTLRCAICHDDARGASSCVRCGSVFHADCREGLGRCPSLGCQALAPLRSPLQLRDRFHFGRALSVSLLSTLLGSALYLVSDFLTALPRMMWDTHPDCAPPSGELTDAARIAWALFALACVVHFIVLPVRWTRQASPELTRRDALRSVLALDLIVALGLGLAVAAAPLRAEEKLLLIAAVAVFVPPITAHVASGRSIL